MPKGVVTQKELLSLSKGKFKTLLNDVKKIGCPVGKADGGRVEFSEGLDCFNKGVKRLTQVIFQKALQRKTLLTLQTKPWR